jgi:hypothetical protein
MIIRPKIHATPDRPNVQFHEPQAETKLDVQIPRILYGQGWEVGTYFNVQFVNHERTKLLSSALFVVIEESESLHVNEDNPDQSIAKTIFSRKAERVSDWWYATGKRSHEDESMKAQTKRR